MYLSHLLIDTGENPDRPRPGRTWLRNLYRVHQRLCMAFPSSQRKAEDARFLNPYRPADFAQNQVHVPRGQGTGFLFRVDPRTVGRAVILVQSALAPDWEYAFQNAAYLLAAPPAMKSYNPSFSEGQTARFRLLANPTRKIDTKTGPDGKRRHGKRVPVREDRLFDWLSRRAEQAGFSVRKNSTTVQPGYIYVSERREGNGRRMRSVRYDGILEIVAPGRLVDAVIRGVGPGKAFGFGLLSVAPVTPATSKETL